MKNLTHTMKNYNENSNSQLASALRNLSKASEISSLILDLDFNSYNLIDYGCSEGRNSCIIFKSILETLRQKTTKDFFIFHTDLATINWAGFFQTITNPLYSYLHIPNTYSSAIAKSFYDQCVPDEFVHFGYSNTAFH